MKRAILYLAFVLILSACAPSEATIATTAAETDAARPSLTPSSTSTPKPTATITPTSTATIVPDVVSQSFVGISLLHEEDFNAPEIPANWSSGRRPLSLSANGELVITGPTEAIYSGLSLGLNQGFVGRLMSSPLADFYVGFEGTPNGQIVQRYAPNSSSFVFDMETPRGASSQIWRADDFGFIPSGDSLLEAVWYSITLGVDQNKNLRIRVWNEDQTFSFDHPLEAHGFPQGDIANNFRFVVSVRNYNGTVYLDDLKIFEFEGFANQ